MHRRAAGGRSYEVPAVCQPRGGHAARLRDRSGPGAGQQARRHRHFRHRHARQPHRQPGGAARRSRHRHDGPHAAARRAGALCPPALLPVHHHRGGGPPHPGARLGADGRPHGVRADRQRRHAAPGAARRAPADLRQPAAAGGRAAARDLLAGHARRQLLQHQLRRPRLRRAVRAEAVRLLPALGHGHRPRQRPRRLPGCAERPVARGGPLPGCRRRLPHRARLPGTAGRAVAQPGLHRRGRAAQGAVPGRAFRHHPAADTLRRRCGGGSRRAW